MQTLQQEIQEELSQLLEIPRERIQPHAHFVHDLDADSMDALEMLMLLEEKYQIEINQDLLPELVTLQKVTELVDRLRTKKGGKNNAGK